MDVTSLLNSSSIVKGELGIKAETRSATDHIISTTSSTAGVVAECSPVPGNSLGDKTSPRRVSDARAPSRSRTPWSANGYALPLTLDTKSTQAPGGTISSSTSPAESGSPKSPRHKFSDSHSSLSSYTSSSTSLSHSRISSMSTVGGIPPVSSMPDTPSLETQFECVEFPIPRIWPSDVQQRLRRERNQSPPAIDGEKLVMDLGRLGSPSDAMLMSRGTQSVQSMQSMQGVDRATKRKDSIIAKDIRPNLCHLVPLEFAKVHKRAISAPDFAPSDTIDREFPPPPSTFQPTSSPSHRGEPRSSFTMETTPYSPPQPGQTPQDDGVFCMYKTNCDTGSQLRKAISHIFGRNKTCTRNIPSHVWVHFCRKHYQRSRYRNAQEWARIQCDLVQKQIHRVQEWSDKNKQDGLPGIVQEWSLSMRKREQNRVQEKTGRKRTYRNDSDDDDDDIPDSATLNGTAVPDWLRSKCGDGYSTTEIEEIVARLKQEMVETNMTQIPDIEILPNISMDVSNDTRPKTLMKRKTSAGNNTHKRSQSVGVALRPESQAMARRVSQPTFWRNDDNTPPYPSEKRQRTTDLPLYSDNANMSARFPERPALAPLRDMRTLAHRPAFDNIRENHAEESYYSREGAKAFSYNYDHWPTPFSQRNGSQPAALNSDPNTSRSYLNDRHNPHQRSLSQVEGFQNNFAYRSSSTFPPSHASETAPHYDRGPMPSRHSHYGDHLPQVEQTSTSYQQQWASSVPAHTSSYSGYKHMRHQSTPSAPHSGNTPQVPSTEYEPANSARAAGSYEQPSLCHPRQAPHAPARQYSHRPLVQESDQAKAVFSERR
ncbi:uncharacterized protein F4822DRAFT_428159 [Hypoxylon trugodes]|uniref:uncharacterized protein n=1 Tax=Hypoxylon trugodes TaxID=326681 RepID=UPI002197D383|nr:uncharacterized protein F4822DRAFT_428159 [Hypoxylon trugodes]KAI1389819.1 hypothetical protein F4822DRAFT_428159 [Hypoxylon trugodes]